MWMGTSSGIINVFHTPTLKVRFTGKMEKPGGSAASFISNILHVQEVSSVLVSSRNGDIWIFSDQVVPGGLKVRDRITLPESSPCFHLVKVPSSVPGTVEVWGTMDHNHILLLEHKEKKWKHLHLESKSGDSRLNVCSYITHSTFTGSNGRQCSHAWISYQNQSLLVSFDTLTRKQRCTLNCADQLRRSKWTQ